MRAVISVYPEKMEANQDKPRAIISAGQKEIKAFQEKLEAAINSILTTQVLNSKKPSTNGVEGILISVDL
jgi:hypothetical protein